MMKYMVSRTYWIAFIIFFVIMAGFWAYVLSYVNGCLVTYQDSQPEYVVQDIVEQIEQGDIEKLMSFQSAGSRFEDQDIYKNLYLQRLSGDLTFEQASSSYDALSPDYYVYNGEDKVAEIKLKSVGSEELMFILAVQDWQVDSITPFYQTGNESITIRIPNTYTAYVNDMILEESERTDYTQSIEAFQYAAAYTPVPSLIEYQVSGLFAAPKVEIKDQNGTTVDYTINDGMIIVDTFAQGTMSKELTNMVLTNAFNYSNFFSRDLPGCTESIDPIRYMLPTDSYYLELAQNYLANDMWMYSPHDAPVFTGQTVTNYIPYTDSFFSCDVYFEKTMYLTVTGDTRTDITHTEYYYVLVDGSWVIADMQTIIDE